MGSRSWDNVAVSVFFSPTERMWARRDCITPQASSPLDSACNTDLVDTSRGTENTGYLLIGGRYDKLEKLQTALRLVDMNLEEIDALCVA